MRRRCSQFRADGTCMAERMTATVIRVKARSMLKLVDSSRTSRVIVNFDDVVQVHWRPVFHFVLASVRDRHLAEDLTQDCFWNASRGWTWFRGDCSVTTWLRHIAVNVIKNFVRSRRVQFWLRNPCIDATLAGEWLADSEPSPEVNVMVQERLRRIWQAVEFTSPKQQMAFLLRFAEEMDLSEISSAMGITEGAVKVHLFRAVKSVRKTLQISERTSDPASEVITRFRLGGKC
jgi:RNA polymerase sigma-70 factor (ECF subfamily)